MVLKGVSGKTYNLESKPFAAGGEGEVYNDVNNKKIVCKLYKGNLNTKEKEAKLLFMVKKPPAKEVLDQIAWPLDVLYDRYNTFVGFVMAKLNISDDLNIVYETGEYAKYKNITWSNKIIIAMNLCAVLDAVHKAGHVIGDFNPKNISVNPNTGHIIFVDTDSYHITEGNHIYRCNVGMSEYLPKEIQLKMTTSLASASLPTFSFESDRFALAIHIFQLLMNGCHPFACRVIPSQVSIVKPERDENIVKGFSPFLQKSNKFDIPVFAPEITVLPKAIQTLFNRAFVLGNTDPKTRPTPEEWFDELQKLRANLTVCTRNRNHEYFSGLKSCPWCAAEARLNNTLNNSAPRLSQQTINKPFVSSSNSYGSYSYGQPSQTTVRPTVVPRQTPSAPAKHYERPFSVMAAMMLSLFVAFPILLFFFNRWIILGSAVVYTILYVILFNKKTRMSGYGNDYPFLTFFIPYLIVVGICVIPFFNLKFAFPNMQVFEDMVENGIFENSWVEKTRIETYVIYSIGLAGCFITSLIFAIKGAKSSRTLHSIIGFVLGFMLYLSIANASGYSIDTFLEHGGEGIDFATIMGSIICFVPALAVQIGTYFLGYTGED